MPFITEELWHRLRPRDEAEACIVARWPQVDEQEVDAEAAQTFALLQELISGIRGVRSQYNVAPSKSIAAHVSVGGENGAAEAVEQHGRYFEKLANVGDLTVGVGLEKPKASAAVVTGPHEVFVPLAGMIDLDEERARLQKEIEQKQSFLGGVERKLRNEQFVTRAPEEVVQRERQKAADAKAELQKLRANLEDLG